MFDFKEKVLDPVLRDAFQKLDTARREKSGEKIDTLVRLRKAVDDKVEAILNTQSARGFAAAVGGQCIALFTGLFALSRHVAHAMPHREMNSALATACAFSIGGIALAFKPILNISRTRQDGATFTREVDSTIFSAAAASPDMADNSPLYKQYRAAGVTFNVISSNDERPARLRARIGAAHGPVKFQR